jgi:hypothetical protein
MEYEGGAFYDPLVSSIKKYGENIFNAFKTYRAKASPQVEEIIGKYHDWLIKEIFVCRVPIYAVIETVANVASLGDYEKQKKKYGYDNMFHLYMRIVLKNPRGDNHIVIKTEKNEVVMMYLDSRVETQGECKYVKVKKKLTLGSFFLDGELYQGIENFYRYSATNNNCQRYVEALLKGSNLDTEPIHSFIIQDVDHLISPFLSGVANKITDLASFFSRVRNGGEY